MTWTVDKAEASRTRFRVRGRDHLDTRRSLPAFKSKPLSLELARKVAEMVDHRRAGYPAPPVLLDYFQNAESRIRERLIEWDIMKPEAHAVTRPIADHIKDFRQSMVALDRTSKHVNDTTKMVETLIATCECKSIRDIEIGSVEAALHDLREDGLSVRRRNGYLVGLKSFTRWLVRQQLLDADPLVALRRQRADLDRKYQRRHLRLRQRRT